jgi:hypothetical protein
MLSTLLRSNNVRHYSYSALPLTKQKDILFLACFARMSEKDLFIKVGCIFLNKKRIFL